MSIYNFDIIRLYTTKKDYGIKFRSLKTLALFKLTFFTHWCSQQITQKQSRPVVFLLSLYFIYFLPSKNMSILNLYNHKVLKPTVTFLLHRDIRRMVQRSFSDMEHSYMELYSNMCEVL